MRTFKINDKISIVCDWKKTRMAFKHVANLMIDGYSREETKICYQNRTWERYEFESVAKRLVDKSFILSVEEKKLCLAFLDGDLTYWSGFKAISMVMKMGEVLCNTQKDKNDWKTRMIKAGLENKGLIMPEDWDTLDEDTKTARFDLILKVLDRKEITP